MRRHRESFRLRKADGTAIQQFLVAQIHPAHPVARDTSHADHRAGGNGIQDRLHRQMTHQLQRFRPFRKCDREVSVLRSDRKIRSSAGPIRTFSCRGNKSAPRSAPFQSKDTNEYAGHWSCRNGPYPVRRIPFLNPAPEILSRIKLIIEILSYFFVIPHMASRETEHRGRCASRRS